MGLPAKLVSSSASDLVDGTTNVGAVGDAVNYDEAGRLQNRVTEAYNPNNGGNDYIYDNPGRITQYEGVGQSNSTSFPAYARKNSGYSYDANGNAKSRAGRTLTWDVQNRLKEVKNGSVTEESYLYDPDGQRVKKTAGSSNLYYPFAHYEIAGSTITKYYFFAGQRIAMNKGGTLYYLHSDHLGSTVLTTQGATTVSQQYCAYGRKRTGTTCPGGNSLPTGHTFTGQKLDGTGLQYYNARYYDPTIGAFISPDTVVPDASNVFDYNRYMYARGNALKYIDPSGHNVAYFTGGGSCAQIGMCYTMLSSHAAAKQEAEVALAVQATASLLLGDVNDVVTVATGYDVIRGESVPYLSQEWAETLGWAALPIVSRSGLNAVEEIGEAAFGFSRNLPGFKRVVPHAQNYMDLGLDPYAEDFAQQLWGTMKGTEKIHFDVSGMTGLTGVDGVLTGPTWANPLGSTNWELRTIWDDPELLGKTTFYRNGEVISADELLK